ncbi:hypothetical protein HMPREF0101_01415 [Bacteroides fragilis]|nr:hypothetical protein HMPREF0101_01415 [Bacteroides fragilis]
MNLIHYLQGSRETFPNNLLHAVCHVRCKLFHHIAQFYVNEQFSFTSAISSIQNGILCF